MRRVTFQDRAPRAVHVQSRMLSHTPSCHVCSHVCSLVRTHVCSHTHHRRTHDPRGLYRKPEPHSPISCQQQCRRLPAADCCKVPACSIGGPPSCPLMCCSDVAPLVHRPGCTGPRQAKHCIAHVTVPRLCRSQPLQSAGCCSVPAAPLHRCSGGSMGTRGAPHGHMAVLAPGASIPATMSIRWMLCCDDCCVLWWSRTWRCCPLLPCP
jgi:hypothetical protein